MIPGERLAVLRVGGDASAVRPVARRAAAVAASVERSASRLEDLESAVAEAVANAIEHGNRNEPGLSVEVTVAVTDRELSVWVVDRAVDPAATIDEAEHPDIGAVLDGQRSTRGWGLGLMHALVDEVRTARTCDRRAVGLVLRRDRAVVR